MAVPKGSHINRLGRPAVRLVEDYLLAQWDKIKAGGMAKSAVAEDASKFLGFEVTTPNITGACRGLGRPWPSGRGPSRRKECDPDHPRDKGMRVRSASVCSSGESVNGDLPGEASDPQALEHIVRCQVAPIERYVTVRLANAQELFLDQIGAVVEQLGSVLSDLDVRPNRNFIDLAADLSTAVASLRDAAGNRFAAVDDQQLLWPLLREFRDEEDAVAR